MSEYLNSEPQNTPEGIEERGVPHVILVSEEFSD